MRYVQIPGTDLQLARVSFGAIPIRSLSFDESRRVILESCEYGINFFDTARGYGDSEEKLGYALQDRRQEVVLATKTARRTLDEAREELETSLSNLETDYIDLYQLHNVSSDEDFEKIMADGGALEALREAQDEGLVRYVGVTSHDTETSKRLIRSGEFVSIMIPLNFMEDDFTSEVLPLAQKHNVAVINMKPFAGGMIEEASLALRYVLGTEGITLTIPGMSSVEEVQENVGFADSPQELTEAELAELEEFKNEIGSEFCRSCDYCQPCPNEVEISRVLRSMRGFRRLGQSWLKDNLSMIRKNVQACEDCGVCLPRCPYNLDIPRLLQEQLDELQEHVAQST